MTCISKGLAPNTTFVETWCGRSVHYSVVRASGDCVACRAAMVEGALQPMAVMVKDTPVPVERIAGTDKFESIVDVTLPDGNVLPAGTTFWGAGAGGGHVERKR